MLKVLILCDVYPPAFAPRMGYLVKYLREYNWEADILTRQGNEDGGFDSLLGTERIIRVAAGEKPLITWWDKVFRLLFRKRSFIALKRPFLDAASERLNPDDYTLILCSTAYRLYVLFAAADLARRWNKPWIADLRDIHEQKPAIPLPYSRFKKWIIDSINLRFTQSILQLRNQLLEGASVVTTVTPWHASVLLPSNVNTQVIYNGFDPVT